MCSLDERGGGTAHTYIQRLKAIRGVHGSEWIKEVLSRRKYCASWDITLQFVDYIAISSDNFAGYIRFDAMTQPSGYRSGDVTNIKLIKWIR